MNNATDELLQLEMRYWQAIKEGDAKVCAELSLDPCLVAGAQGVGTLTRDELRTMMEKQQQYTLDHFEITDAKARMLRPDVGIIAYTVREELTVDGAPISFEAADTSTWVRRDGKWCCAMHTESILGDPFGRDKSARKAPAREDREA